MKKIIFFGNGMLADYALGVLKQHFEVIFHARTKDDLTEAVRLKKEFSEAHGVLASFGVMVESDVLEVFEPEGILNIHPSLLPKYRGASPIESAILNGDTEFSVSIMKLTKAMDAGPIYCQATLRDLPLEKAAIYQALAEAGAEWLVKNMGDLPTPVPQDDSKATFTRKFEKKDGLVDLATETVDGILRKIVAFAGFPKVKTEIYGVNCAILEAHKVGDGEKARLVLHCLDGEIAIDVLQPDGRKAMDAQGFLNGYAKKQPRCDC